MFLKDIRSALELSLILMREFTLVTKFASTLHLKDAVWDNGARLLVFFKGIVVSCLVAERVLVFVHTVGIVIFR